MIQAAEAETHLVHVRGIGVDGWDGTDAGVGSFENEASLKEIFGLFGAVKALYIRHRADAEAEANTSWALIELETADEVEAVLAAVVPPRALVAGSNILKVVKFDKEIAAGSTGGMVEAVRCMDS